MEGIRPTFTVYVTPGPRIFSLQCSHPWEGLSTMLLLWFQSSSPGCISSDCVFLPIFILLTSCCKHEVAETRLHVLSKASAAELEAPELPGNLETASSFTAEDRFLIPKRLPVLENFKWDTLWMRVHIVVGPSSWSLRRTSGVTRYEGAAEVVATAETLLFMDKLWIRSSTDVTESFLKRLYLVRWSMPFYLVSCICSGKSDANAGDACANIAGDS